MSGSRGIPEHRLLLEPAGTIQLPRLPQSGSPVHHPQIRQEPAPRPDALQPVLEPRTIRHSRTPSVRSGMARIPTAHLPPTSSPKAQHRPNAHSDTEPNLPPRRADASTGRILL